ncbi:ankyrin repeat domain-containing protein 26-like [Macrotis lagotis]|uniref:ankyrin repeat domain-containing protein 26-like n=1 Tax=Macrotis lagotis TaxID=92651 RepID=UPI003D691CD3
MDARQFTVREEEESLLRREIQFKEIKKQLRTTKEQYKEEELKQLELTKMKSYLKQVEGERNDAQRQLSQEKRTRALQERNLHNVRKEKEAAASKMMQDLMVAVSCENKNYLLDDICGLNEEVAAIQVELEGDKFKEKQRENVQNQGKVLQSDFIL